MRPWPGEEDGPPPDLPPSQPSPTRLQPPRLPPAPPSAPEDQPDDPRRRVLLPGQFFLECGLNNARVVQCCLASLEILEKEHQPEFCEILATTRSEMSRALHDLRRGLMMTRFLSPNHLNPIAQMDGDAFAILFRQLVSGGMPRCQLDFMLRVELFVPVAAREAEAGQEPETMYRYSSFTSCDPLEVHHGPAFMLFSTAIRDLHDALRDDAHFADLESFEREVFQCWAATLFCVWAATDPAGYRQALEAWEEQGSCGPD